jgi:adenylate cyclase
LSGLVLMAYATTHLLNHALGLVSLDAMTAAKATVFGVWHRGPGNWILLAALTVHVALAVRLVATRLGRGLAGWQWVQLGLGVVIPLMLAQHVAGTALLEARTGAQMTYEGVLLAVWPDGALSYVAMIVVVWLHGCLGLHYWWRLSPRYARLRPWLIGVAVAVPSLAVGGFVTAGREVVDRAPTEAAGWAAANAWPPPARLEALVAQGEAVLLAAVYGGLAAALVWWGVRIGRTRRRRVAITYPSGRTARGLKGQTLLEMSRAAGIPHAAVCGGRARCSTCRVRVTAGAGTLPPPNSREAHLLARLGHPPEVRLACQVRPVAPLAVVPLVTPPTALADARADADPNLGREREVAVLFADLRGFTGLSETRLPYDVVFLLNQYFRAMGEAIEREGGHVDKFLGDGIMALFGLETTADEAAKAALRAAVAMGARLEQLNAALAAELETPLRMGIGLHLGPAIVGEMGHGAARQLTAVGDTVNVASRLDAVAKAHAAELVASSTLLERAGRRPDATATVAMRGRSGEITVAIFTRAEAAAGEAPARPALESAAS